jgi:hypothetical protein
MLNTRRGTSPLKLPSTPFCHGLPASMQAVSMPAVSSHRRIARDTNSGPVVRPKVTWAAVAANGRFPPRAGTIVGTA